MKVLLATESYWPNRDGGAVFERALVHGLGELGHEVRVAAPSQTGKPFVERDGRSDIHRMRSFKLPGKISKFVVRRSTLWPKRAVFRLVDGFQPDVIHGHNPFSLGRLTLKAAQTYRIPYVATFHNMPENTVDNVPLVRHLPGAIERTWKVQMEFLNKATFVTSPTQSAIDLLTTHGLKAPHRPISNGIDLKRFNPDVPAKDLREKLQLPNKPIVLYMGRLDGEKRMDVWLKSVPLIRKDIDAHFLIGGRGAELDKLKRMAVDLNVREHITFAGLVEDDDLPAFYRLGTLFAISSPAELQSIVALEAMASGLPVVACDAVALPELCISGRNGYLFLPNDPDAMAKSTVRILQSPAMGKKMGEESRKIVEHTHDIRQMPKNYEAVYQRVATQS